jgi:hypothetical protein
LQPSSSRAIISPSEQLLWRNRQKLFDGLLSLQRNFPNGQPSSLSPNPPQLADAATKLKGEMLEGNVRWFATLITQRMVRARTNG